MAVRNSHARMETPYIYTEIEGLRTQFIKDTYLDKSKMRYIIAKIKAGKIKIEHNKYSSFKVSEEGITPITEEWATRK